ncbi:dynein regulation protein LC7 [Streptomyces aureoverticillatus]|nr:dynein regulation protein LC7 [Streptomyces aureoverticillatus]
MIQQRANFDWMLKELADGVHGVRQIVVLSADGLRIARHGGDPDGADRLAAACAGLQSLAAAVATEIPESDGNGRMRMVIIEVDGGYFYMMAAGAGAYLAVLAEETVDAGLIGNRMRDLVVRIGAHLTSPPRRDGQAV